MNVCLCFFSVFVLSCEYIAALRRADHSSKESYHLCKKDYETEEEARAQQMALEPLMNEWMNPFLNHIHKCAQLNKGASAGGIET
jgi:hypothetical protein